VSPDPVELERLAHAVLMPGFAGTEAPPGWLVERLRRGLGSVALFGRNCQDDEQVSQLVARLREHATGLVVAVDEEGGDVTRLDARRGSPYPGALVLGTADDPVATRAVARTIAARLARLGVDLDLAPVADVGSNPANPVIGVRSFGADPSAVARHVVAFTAGLADGGVRACVKHFPGHGDTSLDSHVTLPVVPRDRAALDEVELVPFRAAVAAGAPAVMTAHLLVPSLDADLPATLSTAVVGGLLRGELGFTGAVVSDGLEMAALAAVYGVGGAAVRALAAGCDLLCLGGDTETEQVVDEAVLAIVAAVRSGELPAARLAEAARRTRLLRAEAAAPDGSLPELTEAELVDVAARAVRSMGDVALGRGPALVVELDPVPTIAVGRTRWGLAEPMSRARLGTRVLRLAPDGDVAAVRTCAQGICADAVVVVTRDEPRHPWQSALVHRLRSELPGLVHVEMGVPCERPLDVRGRVWTHGASRASATAAVRVLCGSPT
jgi:beta-N-acetylhexosaminidase